MMIAVDQTTMERMTAVASDPSGATAPIAEAFNAKPAERLDSGPAPSSLAGANRWIALAAALLLHTAIFGPLWFGFDWLPKVAPPVEEIPVEVVVEPPPPPPQPQPQPSPSAEAPPKPPIDLEPAHDAPRAAASDVKTPQYGDDAAKNADKQAPPEEKQAGERTASAEEAKPAEPTADRPAAAKDLGDPMQAIDDAQALAQAPGTIQSPDSQTKIATMIGQPLPTWSKSKQFSTFDPIPDVQFGASAASPIGGGNAKTTYLTIVYGLIMKHLRMTDTVRASAERAIGSVSFIVDGHGDVIQRSVTQPSGFNALDAAALEAVREAAPYPAPPMGLPVGLKFTYGGKAGG